MSATVEMGSTSPKHRADQRSQKPEEPAESSSTAWVANPFAAFRLLVGGSAGWLEPCNALAAAHWRSLQAALTVMEKQNSLLLAAADTLAGSMNGKGPTARAGTEERALEEAIAALGQAMRIEIDCVRTSLPQMAAAWREPDTARKATLDAAST